MKKIIITMIMLFALAMSSTAQLGNFATKVKSKINSKVNQRVDSKVDKQIDETLDAAEGKAPTPKDEVRVTAAATPDEPMVKSSSKYDFVPGEQIIYADDFADDEVGELPLNWNTRNFVAGKNL